MDFYIKWKIKYKNTRLVFFALALFSSCLRKEEKMYTETVEGMFDTVHIISSYDKSEGEFKRKVELYKNEMERLHKLYTIYEDIEGINNIKTINDNAGIRPVKVDADIIRLIKDSIKWNREISSKVDISAGKVIEEWEKARKEGKVPSSEELLKASECTGIDNIIINEKESTVFLKKKCTKINVGAVAKGYAAEIAADKMEREGMTSFIISAGGNVKAVGKRRFPKEETSDLKSCREEFCIGVTLPIYNDADLDKENIYSKGKGKYLSKVSIKDMSVVTTGNYERYYILEKRLYGHIIDLDLLKPGENFASVTVITENSGFADFMSTALFLLSYEEGKELLEKINRREKIEAIWAMKNGDIEVSKGLINGENYVKYNFK